MSESDWTVEVIIEGLNVTPCGAVVSYSQPHGIDGKRRAWSTHGEIQVPLDQVDKWVKRIGKYAVVGLRWPTTTS